MKLQAVLFDLDGVVTDTAKYHFIAWRNMAKRIGITIDSDFNESLKGIERMQSLERILVHGGREQTYSQEEKERLAREKNDEYVSLLAGLTPEDTYPGIQELLHELRERRIPAVIASASKNAPLILEALRLNEYFHAIVDPGGIPGKPAPDIFLQAAKLAGADPAGCVGIEDSQAGIEAIKAAGMYAVGIGDAGILGPSGADLICSSTKELTLQRLLVSAGMES
ncbi:MULTISPECIES: beta-phosphoglucomutase [Paenibacillus]|uniref:Beta-phosphoglucomutase n=1 Tax=Paenibacillus albilobatus TaxID=2716884 RepID=A0A920CBX4_9BACL|nr:MULTISPECIES: beta-phosphoglucomutase [Paenibacillus]GIO34061.1 beta-phosphoglucomutase [Paenibacillus albilobatus]